jgi:hypothetical protein
MIWIPMRPVLLSVAAASVWTSLPPFATAQMLGGGGMGSHAPQQQEKPPEPPPAAVPGSRVGQEVVAPPDRSAGDLQPNDALFDSINRGDLAAARDAVNRGADLNARNVLGMTPLDLSIDLGRNNISFLLLSLRPSPAGNDLAAATVPPGPPKIQHTERHQQQQRTPAGRRTTRFASGDGGTPIPTAGFLGFDMGHTAETH